MTVDNILKKLGKSALEQVSKIESPIDKLDTYLRHCKSGCWSKV